MSWIKKLIFPLAVFGAMSSALVACGRKSSDDVRSAARGNVAIDGNGIVSSSTLEGQPYTIRVLRVYRNSTSSTGSGYYNNNYNNGYNYGSGSGSGYTTSGYTTNCQASNQYGYYSQSSYNTIYMDVVVNGTCKTMTLSSAGSLVTDADLGLEVSYSCDSANTCDSVYVDIVGRNPKSYTSTTGSSYTAQPGGSFTYGYASNWAMQPNTEIEQIGLLALVSQLRIAATVEFKSTYSQRLRMDQLMSELQKTNYETTNH